MPWIIAGGSIISGLLGSSASKSAAKAQTQAAQQQIAEQRRQYDQTRADQTPFRETGVAANARLASLLGLNASRSGVGTPEYQAVYDRIYGEADAQHRAAYGIPLAESGNYAGVQEIKDRAAREAEAQYRAQYGSQTGGTGAAGTDPSDPYGLKADKFYASGLQFGLDQGIGALNARAIAGGGYDSGAALKAITRYANDYGSTKANDVYNRLAGVSGAGQTATNQIGAAGQNMANQVSGALGDAGNARAAGIVGGANAWTNAAQQGWNNYNNKQFSDALAKLRGGSGYGTDPYAPGYGGSSYNQLYGAAYGAGGDPLYG